MGEECEGNWAWVGEACGLEDDVVMLGFCGLSSQGELMQDTDDVFPHGATSAAPRYANNVLLRLETA
jgi:hypothetical protein